MLFELIYRSEAKPDVEEEDLLNILSTARTFNGDNDITGCLLYNNGSFVQMLEGEFTVLNELYLRIREDKRHKNVVTLHMKEITERLYPDWKMAFKQMEADDMRHVQSSLGINQFKELNSVDSESPVSRQLFWLASQSIF